jgi:hypothetical protein
MGVYYPFLQQFGELVKNMNKEKEINAEIWETRLYYFIGNNQRYKTIREIYFPSEDIVCHVEGENSSKLFCEIAQFDRWERPIYDKLIKSIKLPHTFLQVAKQYIKLHEQLGYNTWLTIKENF